MLGLSNSCLVDFQSTRSTHSIDAQEPARRPTRTQRAKLCAFSEFVAPPPQSNLCENEVHRRSRGETRDLRPTRVLVLACCKIQEPPPDASQRGHSSPRELFAERSSEHTLLSLAFGENRFDRTADHRSFSNQATAFDRRARTRCVTDPRASSPGTHLWSPSFLFFSSAANCLQCMSAPSFVGCSRVPNFWNKNHLGAMSALDEGDGCVVGCSPWDP